MTFVDRFCCDKEKALLLLLSGFHDVYAVLSATQPLVSVIRVTSGDEEWTPGR